MSAQPLPHSEGCFVCGEDNPYGLRLRFFNEDSWVFTRFELPQHFRGFLDRTHGGVVSALVDEVMGWATVVRGRRFSYTVELKVRFHQPVSLDTPLLVRGRVARHNRRLSFAEAEIRDDSDRLLVSAEGKFVMLSKGETVEIAGALIYSPDAWRVLAEE